MHTEQMTGSYKTEIRNQDLKVAWVQTDINSDDNSFHNFTVLGKNECRWAYVLYQDGAVPYSDGALEKDGDEV